MSTTDAPPTATMNSEEAVPYIWAELQPPSEQVLKMWYEVGNKLDKESTVVWNQAVDTLNEANKYLRISREAREFVERYMGQIVSILLEQQPLKVGQNERRCVQEALTLAVTIISDDLEIQIERGRRAPGGPNDVYCRTLDVLACIFCKKKPYYKGMKGSWNVNHLSGLPITRLNLAETFLHERGFARLVEYMTDRIVVEDSGNSSTADGTTATTGPASPSAVASAFPNMDLLHQTLPVLLDVYNNAINNQKPDKLVRGLEQAAFDVSKAAMRYITSCSEEALKKISIEDLKLLVHDMLRIFDKLIRFRRTDTYDFYVFWRSLVLKLITSQSLPLKLFGWQQMEALLEASAAHRPPPRSFAVSNAGCTFVNGEYGFNGLVTDDGYGLRSGNNDISYERNIPEDEPDGGGKKLTLFRCTMRSQQKWWFLSEADEEQPGTDRDTDYYQHKSKEHEETEPPPNGWLTCRNSGVEPPPTLTRLGLMVPRGEERNTLEHQLARWAIDNKIIETLVLGDSIHREVVSRSVPLINFLACMCERDNNAEKLKEEKATDSTQMDSASETEKESDDTKYCLQAFHLLLAWKTCTRKTDTAVSAQIYQVLVSILPSCPPDLAMVLLKAVQESLVQGGKHNSNIDFLTEVSDFCEALAVSNSNDNFNNNNNNANNNNNNKSPPSSQLSEQVRAEVLKLLWSLLIHPEASSLKSYELLKEFVTRELRVEPGGKDHRETYLRSCITALMENSKRQTAGTVDEIRALKMVKLTHFVLESCPRTQAAELVTTDQGGLPLLLFEELTAFLKRKRQGASSTTGGMRSQTPARKSPSIDQEGIQGTLSLSERLGILRYVYGVSEQIFMTTPQLHSLWQLCSAPPDREEVMAFISSASGTTPHRNTTNPNNDSVSNQGNNSNMIGPSDDVLSSVFTEDECVKAFLTLFCSPNMSFEQLGMKAYQSFHFMFNKMRLSSTHGPTVRQSALDTLWRICLVSGNDIVATSAMTDLLNIYIRYSLDSSYFRSNIADISNSANLSSEPMQTDSRDDGFGKRVFECLSDVKKGLEMKNPSAELAAERCLRILNAAIGQGGSSGSISISTLNRLSRLTRNDNLHQMNKYLPHGMRGQACYRKITVLAKRQQVQTHQGPQTYQERDQSSTNQLGERNTFRFSLDVHPLETLQSIKLKVAINCQCPNISWVKLINAIGRVSSPSTRKPNGDLASMSPPVLPEDAVVDEMGIVQGCDMVFVINDRNANQPNMNTNRASAIRNSRARDLSDIFCDDNQEFSDKLFNTLLGILEALPWREPGEMTDAPTPYSGTHKLVWDLLLAMPTNQGVSSQVLLTGKSGNIIEDSDQDEDAMDIDSRQLDRWAKFLDLKDFSRSVYVLLAIDAFLQPATEIFSSLQYGQKLFPAQLRNEAANFRRGFIDSGGFDAIVAFFSFSEDSPDMNQSMTRRGNAVALRILKCCLFGDKDDGDDISSNGLDEAGNRLLMSLANAEGLLRSLTSMVVADSGISSSTVSDVLKFLSLLFKPSNTVKSFASLPDKTAEKFLIRLLLWEGGSDGAKISTIASISKVRIDTQQLVLATPLLASFALPWLKNAIDSIDVTSESTGEYFVLLKKLVTESQNVSQTDLSALATAVCAKLAACPRPSSDALESSTGVLCGCLGLLDALIIHVGGKILVEGTSILLNEFKISRWSEMTSFPTKLSPDDVALVNLMGIIFDAFLSPGGATSVLAICCDRDSRQRGFDIVKSSARQCKDGNGYMALVHRINGLVSAASPFLKHRWGQSAGSNEGNTRHGRSTSKYSGLKNQGCTCYMNSVLQQLFMMPELRKSLCSAPLPASIRASGGVVSSRGIDLVGKQVAMQWESGQSYAAMVEAFDSASGMHTIRYCKIPVATVGGSNHQQVLPEEVERLPPLLPEEFFLSEGRPGKETGVFEVLATNEAKEKEIAGAALPDKPNEEIKETEDESSSRHLMEEVQRTFIHLEEGSRGRCFDPRTLVEACSCLKLEFDVWQQNDASEFSTKLLDRLETSLKRWAPEQFKYLDHTFGIKVTKVKTCKECGLKTNREEKLLNVICQIRGKADIHESLAEMCQPDIMDGNNKVYCDRCKRNTHSVLRTTFSELPNMLILSLKRFDLDYNTFETVKLNSRCAFEQMLNMKRYTLEGVEALEQAELENQEGDAMDVGNEESAMSHLPDKDYEFKLAGVLVHAGVAQGGHYYSFINDRNPGSEDKWYRFDDEDVTPFDPASIASECFGGKVKKETKWPNGQVHSVESEQFANALMLFYEKVKITEPSAPASEKEETQKAELEKIQMTTGYNVFEPDVRRSNATYRWQSFLFNHDFQAFLRGLLHQCRMPDLGSNQSMSTSKPTGAIKPFWRKEVIDMLVTFMFDVLLYSSVLYPNERVDLMDWVNTLDQILLDDPECAQALTLKIATKTKSVSGNWLRTYLLDCPDQYARFASVRIFTAALRSCLSITMEQGKLREWTEVWKRQISQIDPSNNTIPCLLSGAFAEYENAQSSSASTIGIILSYLNVLIDMTPRYWRWSQELFAFIRDLSFTDVGRGGSIFRDAINACMIPTRMICFVNRHRSPAVLRSAFPGASVSIDTAESQARPEQAQHVMPMNGNQVMNPPEMNFRGNATTMDYTPLYEALGCLMGVPGIQIAALVLEKEHPRGRKTLELSEKAMAALTKIFEESCTGSVQGMGQREIENYLLKCGHDNVAPQRIIDIMSKYNSMAYGGNVTNYINLDGFLGYYRDAAQREDMRVRNDLYLHGYRADLSRRSRDIRFVLRDGREDLLKSCESIARDVASNFKNRPASLGKLADSGMSTYHFYSTLIANASEQLAEYIIAAAFYGKNSDDLIYNTLKSIYVTPPGWQGNEMLTSAVTVLSALASIPDEHQKDRIDLMMQCGQRINADNHPIGLMKASVSFNILRQRQGSYSHELLDAYERYINILKDLINVHAVLDWMEKNRSAWATLNRDLFEPPQHVGHGQSRGDYSGRRDNDDVGGHLDHNHHSDSDVLPGMNESEDDDDDSRFDDIPEPCEVDNVRVANAGNKDVNGLYSRDGHCEGVVKYSRFGMYKGKECKFSLFKCNVSNNTQHWYISVVPDGREPGTSQDTDFYSASVTAEYENLPPVGGWNKCTEGAHPPPTLTFVRGENEPAPIPQYENTPGDHTGGQSFV